MFQFYVSLTLVSLDLLVRALTDMRVYCQVFKSSSLVQLRRDMGEGKMHVCCGNGIMR